MLRAPLQYRRTQVIASFRMRHLLLFTPAQTQADICPHSFENSLLQHVSSQGCCAVEEGVVDLVAKITHATEWSVCESAPSAASHTSGP
mmetsp:Transcript_47772/g.97660  ORF Transcript_47772/g.97660 Transcript_47772/m.97660 type:complete len:89 (-) Transcript_47772:188-454(-)